MVVSLTVLGIVMTIFTSAMLQMYRVSNRSEATANAQSQINNLFLRLDKEIRYAAGISTPGTVGGDPYVEFLTTYTGTAVCTELRLRVSAKQLQRRTWTQGASPLAPTAWVPLASEISSSTPFSFIAADPTFNFQRLRLQLTATSGAGTTATPKNTDVTFTAMNTSLTTSSATVCNEGRTVP